MFPVADQRTDTVDFSETGIKWGQDRKGGPCATTRGCQTFLRRNAGQGEGRYPPQECAISGRDAGRAMQSGYFY